MKNGRVLGKLTVTRAFGDLKFKNKEQLCDGVVTCKPDLVVSTAPHATDHVVLVLTVSRRRSTSPRRCSTCCWRATDCGRK